MGAVEVDAVDITGMSDAALAEFLKKNAISLKLDEARKVAELIGRNPTLVELNIFNIQWSEHSSYKSSRAVLKMLPTDAPNVILGPVEDSGVIELGYHNNERYGIVVSHESHNHPSQVVPYEGAATGVGGIIRDIVCMGSKVFATADPLRFGDPNGKNKNKIKYIANEVINGIAGYGNAVGIPNISGDIYFNDSFDDNCLVNVVCLGVIKEKDIIHSYAPKDAEGYDIILVGKATDNSGFGGAAFASLILDEEEKESNRGAVQVPDPFLKNILIRSSYAVFEEARKQKIELGYKDLGAGGIMCASSELCSDAGFGAKLDLDNVHTSMNDLPSFIIACSETQERFMWISPKKFSKKILKIYNKDFELPRIAEGAKAVIVGEVTKDKNYEVTYQGKIVCNAPIDVITKGISYEREKKKSTKEFSEPDLKEPVDYNEFALKILNHPNIASKAKCYKHYDTNVMGNTIIPTGHADAGLMNPLPETSFGVALKADCNPRYTRIDPYWGAVAATAESMRNVAAVGATPSALTDCLNYGNPEKPEAFHDFYEGVRGIADAANKLHYKGSTYPVPIVSGNVSFYNESKSGKSVDPSPIVACVGIMEDYSKAVTMQLKQAGSTIFMAGERKDELGGSVYYEVNNEIGANVPKVEFEEEKNMIHATIDAINQGLVNACHDISDGGLLVAAAEMILGGEADGSLGLELTMQHENLETSKVLFSESSGFLFEAKKGKEQELKDVFKSYGLDVEKVGEVKGDGLIINHQGTIPINLSIAQLKEAWTTGFAKALQ